MVMNKNIKEMGDGFYIVTEEGSNGMGGFCCHNVELRKHDDPSFCAEMLMIEPYSVGQYSLTEDTGRMKVAMG